MTMDSDHHALTGAGAAKHFRDLIKDIDFAMLTTWNGSEMRSRPMSTQTVETDGEIWFFTRIQSGKSHEIEQHPAVNVAYSDPKGFRFVSVSGDAEIIIDREKAKQLWTPHVKEYFDGPEDPELALIRVQIHSGEYWDHESQEMVQFAGAFRAGVMGHPYAPGDSVETTTSQSQLVSGERRI